MLLLLASLAEAACPSGKTVSAGTLLSALSKAESAFADMDEAAFKIARTEARASFDCLDDRLTTDQVVALHIHEALAAFLDGKEPETIQSLQAATRVYGGDALPSRVAPSGTALRDLYDDAWHDIPRDTETFAIPKRTSVYVDGKRTTSRPLRTAALIQLEDSNGKLLYTGYLHPDEPLPPEITENAESGNTARTGVHFGVEAGLPLGARVEIALDNNFIECFVIRVGGNAVPTDFGLVGGLMVAGAVDVPMGSGDWDFEGTFGGFFGNVGPYLIGGAAQYDPEGPFQLNLGAQYVTSGLMADINAQWVW